MKHLKQVFTLFRSVCLTVLIIFMFSNNLNAKNHLKFKYIKCQYAGNIGYISIGVGKNISKKFICDLMYGYTPKRYSINALHSISLKYSYYPIEFNINKITTSSIYTGFAINFSKHNNSFYRSQGEIPYKYYAPTAIHIIPHLGIKFTKYSRKKKKISFFTEIVTLDSYIYKMFNSNFLNFRDYFSYDFGTMIYF